MKAKLIKRNPAEVEPETQPQSSESTAQDFATPRGIAAIQAAVKSRQSPSFTAKQRQSAREQFAAMFVIAS